MRDISNTYYFVTEDMSAMEENGVRPISETILYQIAGSYAKKNSIIKSVIHKKKW